MGRQGQRGRAGLTRLLCAGALVLGIAFAGNGCDRDSGGGGSDSSGRTRDETERDDESLLRDRLGDERLRNLVEFHAELAHAVQLDAAERADHLTTVLDIFADGASPDRLDAARRAWLDVVRPAEQARVFDRPSPDDSPNPLRRISDHSPAPDTFEDLVKHTSSGDASPDAESRLSSPFQTEGDTRRPALYGLELLLWGDDPKGTEQVRTIRAFEGADGPPAARRRLARLASRSLADRLERAADSWGPGGARRKAYLALGAQSAIRRIRSGIEMLLDEDLLDPITEILESDGSHARPSSYAGRSAAVLRARLRGLQNVYRGEYRRTDNSVVDGPGLSAALGALDPEADRRIARAVHSAADAIDGLDGDGVSDGSSLEPSDRLRRARDHLKTVREALDGLDSTDGSPDSDGS